MTGPNVSTTNKPHDMLRSCIVGAILGAALVGAATSASNGFSLSLRAEHNLFHLEVMSGAAPSRPESTADAG